MLTIKCLRCKRKVLRYTKLGKGRVLHCWNSRISKDYSVRDGAKVLCQCGNLIGIAGKRSIKMRQSAFYHTGTKD